MKEMKAGVIISVLFLLFILTLPLVMGLLERPTALSPTPQSDLSPTPQSDLKSDEFIMKYKLIFISGYWHENGTYHYYALTKNDKTVLLDKESWENLNVPEYNGPIFKGNLGIF